MNLDVTEPAGALPDGVTILPPDGDERWQLLLFRPRRPTPFNQLRVKPAHGKGALKILNGGAFRMSDEVNGWREWATGAAELARIDTGNHVRAETVTAALHGAYTVDVYHRRIDRRSRPDVGAPFVAVKAALDGLVDGGLLAGDTPEHLRRLTFWPPSIVGYDGLLLVITTLPDQGQLPI